MGVNASIRDEPDEMKTAIRVFGAMHAFEDGSVLVELTFFDGNVDADNILPDHSTCADVKMTLCTDGWGRFQHWTEGSSFCDAPNFGVAHKGIAETYSESVSGDGSVRICLG